MVVNGCKALGVWHSVFGVLALMVDKTVGAELRSGDAVGGVVFGVQFSALCIGFGVSAATIGVSAVVRSRDSVIGSWVLRGGIGGLEGEEWINQADRMFNQLARHGRIGWLSD